MPPVILFALGVIGAAAAARWLYRESRRINAELHPAEQPAPVSEQETIRLERDPKTGVYRPR
jgi:hypothetical protein